MLRRLLLAAALCVAGLSSYAAWHSVLQVTAGSAPAPLTFDSLANGTVGGAAIAGSGTYTGTAPTSISSATWTGCGGGSSTVSSFSAASNAWSANFTVPGSAGSGCTIAIVDNRSETATSPGVTISAASYSGPCDAVSGCTYAWGVQAPDAASASTSVAAQDWGCTNGGSSQGTINYDTSGGLLASGTNGTSNATSTCGSTIWSFGEHDPIGSLNTTPAAGTSSPLLKVSGCNGSSPCLVFGNTPYIASAARLQTAAASASSSQPITVAAVMWEETSGGGNPGLSVSAIQVMGATSIAAAVDTITAGKMFGGSSFQTVGTITAGTLTSVIYVFNGSSSTICINGTRTTVSSSPGTGGVSTNAVIYKGASNFGEYFYGEINESEIWYGKDMTTTEQGTLFSNQKARYSGLSGSGTCS